METELGATKRSWPGATESSQMSLTVLALTSRKLTLAWTPADADASPIPFAAFPGCWYELEFNSTLLRQDRVERRTCSRYHPLALFTGVLGRGILRTSR